MPTDTEPSQEAKTRKSPDTRPASKTSNRKTRTLPKPGQVYTFPAPPCSTCNTPRYNWRKIIFTPHDRGCPIPHRVHLTMEGLAEYYARCTQFGTDLQAYGLRNYH